MNTQKYLILVKGEDKTEEIISFENEGYYIHMEAKKRKK